MWQSHSGSATLPKGYRYDQDSDPRTPEPFAPGDETSLPSPPPPRPRLKLKRRNLAQLNAPTQQFLASVAAADVPIPSVEEPQIASIDHDHDMVDTIPQVEVEDFDGMDIYQHIHARRFSPPKTPAVELGPALSPTKYPNWSIDSSWSDSDLESSPDYESSRPSTAFSTQTSASLFSQYSVASDVEDCISPELELKEFTESVPHNESAALPKKPRKAPWTKAMTAHLWSTYMLYLQDPRVTPMRLGKSCIPPHGVCLRVAREARRSWKGSNPKSPAGAKSRSSTPTAESSKPFVQWPHTCAATRARLRELCKIKAPKTRRHQGMSRSPTPFNKAAHRRWNRRSTPARSPSVFSPNDMAMSLTMSTSEAMQPEAPLAQLTRSRPEPFPDLLPSADPNDDVFSRDDTYALERTRLGSPFTANSYGPSSSSSLVAKINLPHQSTSLGSRKLLKSPARLTRSRSGTQKRRSAKNIEDYPRKRPSITAAFGEDPEMAQDSEDFNGLKPLTQPHHTISNQDGILFPLSPVAGESVAPLPESTPQEPRPFVVSDSAKLASPRRLGSPFSGLSSSHSFPNRLSAPVNLNLTAFRRPFATIQEPAQATPETPARPSLTSRLAYLDQRLKEFRNRRRSQSPL